jgi:hypothetical protein
LHGAKKIRFEDGSQIPDISGGDALGLGPGDTGIVDQDVESVDPAFQEFFGSLDGFYVGDVNLDRFDTGNPFGF